MEEKWGRKGSKGKREGMIKVGKGRERGKRVKKREGYESKR